MKTLFLSTHKIAQNLDPEGWTCRQLARYIESEYGDKFCRFSAAMRAKIVMEMLYKEQKEYRKWNQKRSFAVFENIFDAEKYDEAHQRYGEGAGFSDHGYEQIRQRLINSLLTRPDRIICVPVFE